MRDVSAATTTLSARPFAQTRAPSFSEAAERHLDDVYRYLLVFTRDASAAEDLAAETFERALRTLSAADREVVALRIVLDLDTDAAAGLLGISTTACTTRLSRALKRLEELMSNDE